MSGTDSYFDCLQIQSGYGATTLSTFCFKKFVPTAVKTSETVPPTPFVDDFKASSFLTHDAVDRMRDQSVFEFLTTTLHTLEDYCSWSFIIFITFLCYIAFQLRKNEIRRKKTRMMLQCFSFMIKIAGLETYAKIKRRFRSSSFYGSAIKIRSLVTAKNAKINKAPENTARSTSSGKQIIMKRPRASNMFHAELAQENEHVASKDRICTPFNPSDLNLCTSTNSIIQSPSPTPILANQDITTDEHHDEFNTRVTDNVTKISTSVPSPASSPRTTTQTVGSCDAETRPSPRFKQNVVEDALLCTTGTCAVVSHDLCVASTSDEKTKTGQEIIDSLEPLLCDNKLS
jgi:hypothetical protein